MTSRRGFLRGLGAASGAVAAGAIPSAEVKNKIVKDVIVHRAVYSDVLVTHGDGSKDGDHAMIKINGVYRNCVRKSGKWGLMFPA